MTARAAEDIMADSSDLSHKYRGVSYIPYSKMTPKTDSSQATVEDMDPPPAFSIPPYTAISSALMAGYERDYTHLTVVAEDNRALLGYISIPKLKELLQQHVVTENDPIEKAMQKFRRKGRKYKIITMDTPLEELEVFFRGGVDGESEEQDFAVVTDGSRKFVLGVATKADLEEFVKRRPA